MARPVGTLMAGLAVALVVSAVVVVVVASANGVNAAGGDEQLGDPPTSRERHVAKTAVDHDRLVDRARPSPTATQLQDPPPSAPWPDLPDELTPDGFQAVLDDAVAQVDGWHIGQVDCSAYPCVAAVFSDYDDNGMPPVPPMVPFGVEMLYGIDRVILTPLDGTERTAEEETAVEARLLAVSDFDL